MKLRFRDRNLRIEDQYPNNFRKLIVTKLEIKHPK